MDYPACFALKRGMGLNHMGSGARLPGFKSWLDNFETMGPQTSYLTALCLSFLISKKKKVEVIIQLIGISVRIKNEVMLEKHLE